MEKVLSRNRFFRDFGTLWPCLADLKFRPPKSTSKNRKWQKSKKSKKPFFSASISPILAYGVSKVAHGYFWLFPAYTTLKYVFTIFLERKYGFFAFFDEKIEIFKSTKWCQSVKKWGKSQNWVYTVFRAQKSPGIDCETQKNDQNTVKKGFEHFFAAVGGVLMQKTTIYTYFWRFLTFWQGLKFRDGFQGATWLHNNKKKSKMPKMSLNTPKLSQYAILGGYVPLTIAYDIIWANPFSPIFEYFGCILV